MDSSTSKKPHKIRRNSNCLDLKARICNQGFALETLPSVKRPGPAFPGLQPLSVRVSSKNQSLIPIIYQSQPSILHKTTTKFFTKGSKPSEISEKLEENIDFIKENDESPEKSMRKSINRHLPPLETNFTASLSIGLNFSTTSNFFNGTQNSAFMSQLRKNNPGFDLEARQSRYLLDKMSGKLTMDHRYLPSKPIKTSTNPQKSLQIFQKTLQIDENPLKRTSFQWDPLQRPPSKIDKYIELIMKNVSNLDEFIYLYQELTDDDPYNLEVIEYEVLKEQGLKDFFTISKKGLCHYENGKPNEFIPLAFWLKERETYDRIKSLKFFKKFRKWKTLKMWKKNIIRHKRIQHKKSLEEGLFVLNPMFRQALITHRTSCMEMEKLRFLEITPQQYGFSPDIPKLEEFQEQQVKKSDILKGKIKEFSQRCRENVRICFKESLEILRNTQDSDKKDPFAEEIKKKNGNAFRLKETAYENLGFDEELSYEKRSELRKECSKFMRFAYLIDFLTLDSLKNVYVLTIDDLLKEMGYLIKIKENFIYREKCQKGSSKYHEPLFYLNIEDSFEKPIEKSQMNSQILNEFLLPPLGKSVNTNFNILYHVFLKPISLSSKAIISENPESEEEEEEEEDLDLYDENKKYQRLICPNLYRIWLNLKPNLSEFLSGLLKSIEEGFKSLQVFERWSRHIELTPYLNILEEWDDTVGGDWDMPETNFLDLNEILDQKDLETYNLSLKTILEEAFQRADKYLESFNEFLTIYWENSKVDMEIFRNPRIIREADSLQNSLNLLNYQKEFLETEIPFQADLGLFRIDSSQIREILLPSPELLLKKFAKILPEQMRIRSKELRDWMINSSAIMKAPSGNLEEFVKQRNSVKRIEFEYPRVKKRLDVVNQISIILKDFSIDMKKEDDQLLVDINHLAINLAVTLGSVSENLEKGMESNALKISRQLIPELEKAINELDQQVNDFFYNIFIYSSFLSFFYL